MRRRISLVSSGDCSGVLGTVCPLSVPGIPSESSTTTARNESAAVESGEVCARAGDIAPSAAKTAMAIKTTLLGLRNGACSNFGDGHSTRLYPTNWRECVGIEPTSDGIARLRDLKSPRSTRAHPFPRRCLRPTKTRHALAGMFRWENIAEVFRGEKLE